MQLFINDPKQVKQLFIVLFFCIPCTALCQRLITPGSQDLKPAYLPHVNKEWEIWHYDGNQNSWLRTGGLQTNYS